MIQTLSPFPGLTLRCVQDSRFKQGCLSVQFLCPMTKQDAAANALIPAVLLRGTRQHPDLRAITMHLDDLYGAAVSPVVRRVGDVQAIGLYSSFIDDRFALPGDRVLENIVAFLRELLTDYPEENGGFLWDFVESEKKNQISAIEAEGNDKRQYALNRTLEATCGEDSFGIPRVGTVAAVAAITPQSLLQRYRFLLASAPVDIFYVGSQEPAWIASRLQPLFDALSHAPQLLPAQTGLTNPQTGSITETQEISQGKLCISYVTPVTNRAQDFAAMQVMNVIFGGGMTSKLFQNVREKQSLCYNIGSSYYSAKGIVLVYAGIDFDKESQTREEIAHQLRDCMEGRITDEELTAGKQALLSALRVVPDSPSAIENYYETSTLSGVSRTTDSHMESILRVTREDVMRAASTLQPGVNYFLKGAMA